MALVALVGCNGLFGLDDVEVRDTGGAGASGGGPTTTGGAGGASGGGGAGGGGQGPTTTGGAGGTGGDPTTSTGGAGGGATLCGPVPADNIVFDGSFDADITGSFDDPWYAVGGSMERVAVLGMEGCDGDYYLEIHDYDDETYGWGSGLWQQVLQPANTACVAWSYNARAVSSDVYTRITLAFETINPADYTVNVITGVGGVHAQALDWTLYEGACELTIPPGIDHINVFLSITEDQDTAGPDTVAQFDALVVRPIECTLSIPQCDVTTP